ncbi:hypothetical protein [Bradyrhizobium jicamae]|uniref:hypothetical protein n=1 Tax=Bradyrhizobium jicamae TaxID=280332 RepID=UPI003D9BADA0
MGDPVAAGQIIGTMGNTGVKAANVESGDHHVHYQLKDPAGNGISPSDFWDEQGPIDPNPAPPAYLDQQQRYLRGVGGYAGNAIAASPGGTHPLTIARMSVV